MQILKSIYTACAFLVSYCMPMFNFLTAKLAELESLYQTSKLTFIPSYLCKSISNMYTFQLSLFYQYLFLGFYQTFSLDVWYSYPSPAVHFEYYFLTCPSIFPWYLTGTFTCCYHTTRSLIPFHPSSVLFLYHSYQLTPPIQLLLRQQLEEYYNTPLFHPNFSSKNLHSTCLDCL